MLIPYRVKNPWKRFPVATVTLMALNVLTYIVTTHALLGIREEILHRYAFQFGQTPAYTMLTSLFLHGDLMHLAGNMLFFWVFAPSVEDRLGIPRYLLVYFVTGAIGNLLQGVVDQQMLGHALPGIGASGCIMGIMGAYWYLFSWSTVCVFYWFFWLWHGIWEVQALWIIGLFVALDLWSGMTGPGNGIANFAHVGGGIAGTLCCMALGMKRDSARMSRAREMQADLKDLNRVPPADLEIMRREDPQNLAILRALLGWAERLDRLEILHTAFSEAGPDIVEQDPGLVGRYLLAHHGDPAHYRPSQLLRIARHLEVSPDPGQACQIYQMVIHHHPAAPEHEVALYRLALCCWDRFRDAATARTHLNTLLTQYPYGAMEPGAQALLRQLGPE